MEKLIKALQIFLKYRNVDYPTSCDHDILCIVDITLEEVSSEDVKVLDELGFHWDDEYNCWASFKYGSA